ncbi:hypothetical protein GUITHDRAFT_145175 [Guillardia theta CCMP2712]|uniref:LysM domain-containing protein n=1 Tax=Guillardia theta (strain CCMP2712) TaxID=905079 RepID=L1ILS9_GUITC|nr:hypothetical protein GUITHDRAFT_145175 [Guillardia theta CCMP2712]EKX37218.1 hypothetical protein GUITHDRAFT_145175 [Guillardia theta CCMP2712]|eukprot:XP_005824198.1 hypothetical protein GUITHDRAFT_145175 [Guillardia theta CCMP2712]
MAPRWRGAAALLVMRLTMVMGQTPAGRAGYSIMVTPPVSGTTWNAPVEVSSPVLNTQDLAVQAWVRLVQKTPASDINYIVGTLNTITSESQSIVFGTWTHISATYSNGTMKFYVDAKQVNSVVLPPLIRSGNVNKISLGGRADFQAMGQTSYLSGNMDEIRIWETVMKDVREGWQLSMDAFETACNASLLSRCKQNGLAYYWSFNDTTAMTSTFYQTESEAVVSGASYMDRLAGLNYQTGGSASMKDAAMQIFEFGNNQVGTLQIQLVDANPLDRLDLVLLNPTVFTDLKITSQVQTCSCYDIFNCSCHQCPFPTICQSSQPFEMLMYIGDNLNFMIQVLLRNVDQQVIFSIDEIYGSPSYATFSNLTTNLQTRSASEPVEVGQRFSWTPVCQQAGLARVLFLVTSREVPSLSISKLIHIDVVTPQPVILNISTSSRLMWKPVRGQEGGEYEICVVVRDGCHVGVPAEGCVNMSIAKCQACLAAGDSLEGLARQYRTDFLSLYTFNVGLGNPDSVTVDRPINVGFLYRVNSDIAERNNIATEYWRGGTVVAGGNTSSILILPGEKVCVVSSVCRVECSSSECKLR